MKKESAGILRDILLTVLFLTVSTVLGILFRQWDFHKTNIVVFYIFSVMLISRFTAGYSCGIGASVVSLLLFNWLFTEPYYTLKVNDMTYLVTFAIMMFTSIVTSTLTTKVKKAASDARARESESNALYRIDEMTNMVPVGQGRVQIIEVQIPGESPAAGKKLWEITLPKESIVGCVLRGDTTLIPRGDTRILSGDTLVVIADSGQELNTVHA